MSKYYFYVSNEVAVPNKDSMKMPTEKDAERFAEEVRSQWNHAVGGEWIVSVTNEKGDVLFKVGAEGRKAA